jgi:hypothetical protein
LNDDGEKRSQVRLHLIAETIRAAMINHIEG